MPTTTPTSSDSKPRVALVFGGRSGEHSVSCIAAGGFLGAIDRDRFDVVPIGIAPSGKWTLAADDPDMWSVAQDGTFPVVPEDGPEVVLPSSSLTNEWRVVDEAGVLGSLGSVDVVFPLLHGPYGEDGTVQGALDLLDIPYVGPGVLASAMAMDKAVAKQRFEDAGLPVVPYVLLDVRTWDPSDPELSAKIDALGLPLFVKPARTGSSLGITKVTRREHVVSAVETAGLHDPRVLVEAAVQGREIECGVLGGHPGKVPHAAFPAEVTVVKGHDFYDFAAKYQDEDAVRLDCPADLPDRIAAQIRDMAVRAFEAIGGEGMARVDFFYDPSRGVPAPDQSGKTDDAGGTGLEKTSDGGPSAGGKAADDGESGEAEKSSKAGGKNPKARARTAALTSADGAATASARAPEPEPTGKAGGTGQTKSRKKRKRNRSKKGAAAIQPAGTRGAAKAGTAGGDVSAEGEAPASDTKAAKAQNRPAAKTAAPEARWPEVLINEINTIPGFTPFSLFPRMWEAAGMDYESLITELLTLALERPTGLR
ncbi:MAG: D-alanine--D-alanine ligase [Bifidobacteriaceae bacterium]|jgi:D-alanine-D-alanine ligase|nr:D-alanine--D-alanine ligase [Bifidobacteriaceae bacterium]